MSSGPTITHAQVARLREVFKGEEGWAIAAKWSGPLTNPSVEVQVWTSVESGRCIVSGIGETVEKAVDALLANVARSLAHLPVVPR